MRVDQPWAKTGPNEETCSLVAHCHHVAIMARQLMASPVLRRRLAAAFETDLTEGHLDRLAVLAGLHDLGKALKGFQDKLEGTLLTSRGHVAEALAALSRDARLKTAVRLPLLSEWFERVSDALYVSICHHGEPVADERIRPHLAVLEQLLARTRYGHDPITEIGKLSDFLIAQFPNATERAPKLLFTPVAQHLFAGILMASDWMASGFAFTPGEVNQLAADVLRRTGWTDWHSGAPAGDLLEGRKPRPAQLGTLALSLDERFAVIEAPTGSGKTEAALIWATRLVEAHEVDGLYFAVPTRSAASELHARIGRLMSVHHPALKGKIVRALPGMLDTDNSVPDYPAEYGRWLRQNGHSPRQSPSALSTKPCFQSFVRATPGCERRSWHDTCWSLMKSMRAIRTWPPSPEGSLNAISRLAAARSQCLPPLAKRHSQC